MKIIQTPPRFIPQGAGIETYVYSLSKELIKSGHKIKVICANEPPIHNGSIDGIEVERLHSIIKISNTPITLALPFKLLKEDFDIIHTHLPVPWSADCSNIVSLIKKIPLILTYHNDITGTGIYSYIAKSYNCFFLRSLLRTARRIIVTHSGHIERSPYLKPFREKIEIIPCAVCLEEFYPFVSYKQDTTKKVIFFLSLLDSFHEYKGLRYLIQAITLIKKEIPEVKLIVGGEGELKDEYKKITNQLTLDKYIEFAGFIPKDKLLEFYNKSDIFALPSISAIQEGFGIVLLEAMACCRPVVTTNITGPAQDIVERQAGIVIKPKDSNALAEAIVTILKDDNLAKQMGQNARRLAEEKYSWNKIALQIEEVYKQVLK